MQWHSEGMEGADQHPGGQLGGSSKKCDKSGCEKGAAGISRLLGAAKLQFVPGSAPITHTMPVLLCVFTNSFFSKINVVWLFLVCVCCLADIRRSLGQGLSYIVCSVLYLDI